MNGDDFIRLLNENGIDFFAGVPDSLLKLFCARLNENVPPEKRIVTPNEGGAIALAAGYYLATGKTALVYMQNSGIGNAVNPLLSLADPKVYSIPMLLLVGWRGEPGTQDEPQHVKQGEVTPDLFEAMQIPYLVLEPERTEEQMRRAACQAKETKAPVALLVRRGLFAAGDTAQSESWNSSLMSREDALEILLEMLAEQDAFFVGTTGFTSRELFELRKRRGQGHERDFLTVGSMGHASMIALGIALSQPGRRVCCLDGDGAFLMHMGGAVTIGRRNPANLMHVVINNGVHDSVGGQPHDAAGLDLFKIAQSCGYEDCVAVETRDELKKVCADPVFRCRFIEIKCRPGARSDLGRPDVSPAQNRLAVMQYLGGARQND